MTIEQFTDETVADPKTMNLLADQINKNTSDVLENTSAIGQIANDRGYLNSKNVALANVNALINNGKYINMSGMPATGSWVVDVISLNATFVTQYASCIYDSQGLGYTGKKLMRDNLGGTWTPWKEIATTDVSLVPKITTATKLSDIVEAGVYRIYNSGNGNGSIIYTDYPPSLKEKGFVYGLLTVSINGNYLKYDLTVCDGAVAESIVVNGFKARDAGNITWSNKEYIQTAFLNGWTTYNPVVITRESVNKVSIKGLIHLGTTSMDTALFVVPPVFKPIRNQWMQAMTSGGNGSAPNQALTIAPDGVVKLAYTTALSYIYMDVTYRLD